MTCNDMANELYIERPNGKIALAEWKSVITGVEGIKPSSGDGTITNPKTAEVLSSAKTEGRVYFFPPICAKPSSYFFWHNGRISFKVNSVVGEIPDCLWHVTT